MTRIGSMFHSSNCLLRCKEKININSMKINDVNSNLVSIDTAFYLRSHSRSSAVFAGDK
jgi:hypothetical protein